MRKFFGYFKAAFFNVNWIKTIRFNFKMFPFSAALKFPVIIQGRCKLKLGGEVVLDVPEIRRGLLKIGYKYEYDTYNDPCNIRIDGKLIITGEVAFGTAVSLYVNKGSVMEIGHNSFLGTKSLIICTKSIIFKDYIRLGAQSIVTDSNYHFMKDVETGEIRSHSKEVFLGGKNFIGMRSVILPGTRTPRYITIGTNSLCNKDYTGTVPECSVIAGIPAKLVKTGVVRIFDFKKEAEISKYMAETGSDVYYDEPGCD